MSKNKPTKYYSRLTILDNLAQIRRIKAQNGKQYVFPKSIHFVTNSKFLDNLHKDFGDSHKFETNDSQDGVSMLHPILGSKILL